MQSRSRERFAADRPCSCEQGCRHQLNLSPRLSRLAGICRPAGSARGRDRGCPHAGRAAAVRILGARGKRTGHDERGTATLLIDGAGDGHGVGMSQEGALRLRRARLLLQRDPRPLLHRHRARPGAGRDEGESAGRRQGQDASAGNLRARRGRRRDARQLADGGARGAGGREPHLRAHRRRGRRALRRLLRHALAGVPRQGRRNRRHQRRDRRHRRADRHLRRQARDHLLLRLQRRPHRRRPGRLPRRRRRSRGWRASPTPTTRARSTAGRRASASPPPASGWAAS